MSDGSSLFKVVKNDCPEKLVNAEFLGDNLSNSAVKLFWESFSFSEDSGEHTQSVECLVKFCITENCSPNECS